MQANRGQACDPAGRRLDAGDPLNRAGRYAELRGDLSGHMPTLEEAKAQFQMSWDAWKAWAKVEEVP